VCGDFGSWCGGLREDAIHVGPKKNGKEASPMRFGEFEEPSHGGHLQKIMGVSEELEHTGGEKRR